MSEFNKQDFKVESCVKSECYDWLLHKHYAHRIPSISYAFKLVKDGMMIGCCTFGKPANPFLCDGIMGADCSNLVYELNRLCVNDGLPRGVLSYFVSQCLRNLPKPMIIVSYADSGKIITDTSTRLRISFILERPKRGLIRTMRDEIFIQDTTIRKALISRNAK